MFSIGDVVCVNTDDAVGVITQVTPTIRAMTNEHTVEIKDVSTLSLLVSYKDMIKNLKGSIMLCCR